MRQVDGTEITLPADADDDLVDRAVSESFEES
jgi:hypothetical protein